MRPGARAWALGVWVLLAACPSFAPLKTARALDQGEYQLTVAGAGVGGLNGQVQPQVEIAARFGVAKGFDLGGTLFVWGAELDSTIQLIKGGVFDLALGPSVSYFQINADSPDGEPNALTYNAVPVLFPVLCGINFGNAQQFVFGPEVAAYTLIGGDGGPLEIVYLGGTLGFSISVVRDVFRITPQINVLEAVAGPTVTTNYATLGDGPLYQFAVGFSFGNDGFGKKDKFLGDDAPPVPRWTPP